MIAAPFAMAVLLAAQSIAPAPASVPVQAQPPVSPAPALPALTPVSPTPAPSAADIAAFRACMAQLRPSALSSGIDAPTFDHQVGALTPDMTVLPLLDAQPEFTTPIWDYLAALVDSERVDDGRAMLQAHAPTLARAAAEYGIDAATIVAVWGVESDYGKTFGKRPLLVSLGTLSCFGRRQAFFRSEFLATLQLLQSGDLRAEGLTGSWAGAFGHTQFMPSTYRRIAVDFDGDGRRDLVASIPDALGSTANYLKRAGWRTGESWGYEIRLPAGFDAALAGRRNKRPLSDWVARGITRIDGSAIAASATPEARAGLLLPAGVAGPAFLVFRNFDAIYSYNAAESYALAIAHLSDRLRGGGAFVTPWPTDDPGLGRAERRELQTLLLARGHAIGEADGMIGTLTRRAIVVEQQRLGLTPEDGRAGRRILDALRAESPNQSPCRSGPWPRLLLTANSSRPRAAPTQTVRPPARSAAGWPTRAAIRPRALSPCADALP